MTEEEAKTKWCPFARPVVAREQDGKVHIDAASPVHNRYSMDVGQFKIPSGATCAGSACMAWRWLPKAGTDENDQPKYYAGSWHGYCGLAGKL
jgi:hypothetical protein